jgi:hypothetical protein
LTYSDYSKLPDATEYGPVVDTEWRKKIKGQWRARGQAVVRREWGVGEGQGKDMVDRGKVYDKG